MRREATVVRVKVADKNRANQLRANLAEWTESPSSLLFFRNLRELTIDGPAAPDQLLTIADRDQLERGFRRL